jgi:hypothetical protein
MTVHALPDFGPARSELSLDLDEGPWVPFDSIPLDELPLGLVGAALEVLAGFGSRIGTALEVSDFAPMQAAWRHWMGYSHGEPVVEFTTWRGVGEVRIGGLPGLLAVDATACEDEPAADAIARGPEVYFVPFATAHDAERIALAPRPGFPMPVR